MKQFVLFISYILIIPLHAYGSTKNSDMIGLWFTQPSPKGSVDVVEIFEENGMFYGYGFSHKNPKDNVVVYDTNNPNPTLRKQQLTGLIIIYDVVPIKGKNISKGYIYDPKSGQTYHLQIKVKNQNTLILKPTVDALGIIGPTITWIRVDEPTLYSPLPKNKLHRPYIIK